MLGWLTRLFAKDTEQLGRVEAILNKLVSKVDTIPGQTIQGLEPLLNRLKVAKSQMEVSHVIHKLAVINNTAIDNDLIEILQQQGRMSIAALYQEATDKQICRRSALFRHLKILVMEGRVIKEMTVDGVFYSPPVHDQSTDTDTKSTVHDTKSTSPWTKSTEDTDGLG